MPSKNEEASYLDRAAEFVSRADQIEKEFRKHISPKGKLGLPADLMPPLLDERRHKYVIPDDIFRSMPSYDTCHVWQIGLHEEETAQRGGVIVLPGQAKAQYKNESPRGVLVSAGLLALDQLRSNGIDLGHVVSLLRMSPYRMSVAAIAGVNPSTLVLHAGDIKGSEDTMRLLREGKLRLARESETVNGVEISRHVYTDSKGNRLGSPLMPWLPED